MDEKNYTGLIPENKEGKEITAEASVTFKDSTEAGEFYKIARKRLLAVNDWGERAGTLSADFRLTDAQGKEANRLVRTGDHFRVDIPGPGSRAGRGYDWVRVEQVAEEGDASSDSQSMTIRVRPSDNPTTDEDDTAHFYSSEATSNFTVKREGNKITAAVHGRNEKPNTGTQRVLDKTRNAAVGATAAAGISTIQWNLLVKGLIMESE